MAKQYRAKEPLYIGVFRAHNRGDLVDADRVDKYGWSRHVEPVDEAKPDAELARKKG